MDGEARCTVCGHVQHCGTGCAHRACLCGKYDRYPKFRRTPPPDIPEEDR